MRVLDAGREVVAELTLEAAAELADEFDLNASPRSQPLGVGADLFAQRLGPLGTVKQADVAVPR